MSILIKREPARRTVLRGMLKGGVVSVALPFLDCFLNENGTALASGAPLPVRFGTWFWGLGHQPGFGFSGNGKEIVLLHETMPLEPLKAQMNAFGGFNARTDGRPNFVHYSGLTVARSGTAPTTSQEIPAPTLDVLVADTIGDGTRFRRLDLSASGGSLSARSSGSRNAAEPSPVALYAKVFGPEFVDPNKGEFRPDPVAMVQNSVLSGIGDESKRFAARLGSADKARMDEYFTAIRELEHQFQLQIERPPPNKACAVPKAQGDQEIGTEIETVLAVNKSMAQIVAMAVACNQTKVFTMSFSGGTSALRKAGTSYSHHDLSHEEPIDVKLGYQPIVAWFNIRSMQGLAEFVGAFASIREGDGTLLDNTLIFSHSDTNDARTHQIDGIPLMTFGKAGGRVKTGNYVAGNGDSITRVGLTAMQIMGVPIDNWGTESNHATKSVSEILV